MVDDQAAPAADINDEEFLEAELLHAQSTPGWGGLWQVPTIVLAAALIVAGLTVISNRAPKDDFDAALRQVEELILDHRLDLAKTRMEEVIEPNLAKATERQRGRFHAVAADWLVQSAEMTGRRSREADQLVIDHYRKAAQMGVILEPHRLEQIALALVRLGDIPEARKYLESLDVLDLADATGPDVRARRNRVLRAVVEQSIRKPETGYEGILLALEEYRQDDRVSLWDHQWAIAREAELRLVHDQPREAVRRLLVEMRRLEHRAGDEPFNFGELYVLLGRGYFDMGEFDLARRSLEEAAARLTTADDALADAEEMLGVLNVADGELEEALERFTNVIQHYVGTAAAMRSQLGRADALSRLGRHDESLDDYRGLLEMKPSTGVVPNALDIGESIVQRVDAALVFGDIDLALRYAHVGEAFFSENDMPPALLERLAVAYRQSAENLLPLDLVSGGDERPSLQMTDLEPGPRYEASLAFEKAGEYAVRHARALRVMSESDDQWSESLWLAADSFDLAGLHDVAITHFQEYLAGSGQVARRADAQFRLAQAYEASFDFENAIENYESVLADFPRTQYAHRSHVPLARALLAVGRRSEAEQGLQLVLAGEQVLQPDAMEYRDALLELGALYHDSGEYDNAIARLDEATKRYPEDPRILEVRFRLADCYRARAQEMIAPQSGPTTVPKSERARIEGVRLGHLERALTGFQTVVAGYEQRDARTLDSYEVDLLRNAYLYRGDCAFELSRYEQAIDLYDQAASRYRGHHSSMHALIQIYNCRSELGDVEGARNAHRRALVRLGQLPDDAFDSPDALMDRAAWERWLSNSPVGPVTTASAADAN